MFKIGDHVCYQNREYIGTIVEIQRDELGYQLIKVELGDGDTDSFSPDELTHDERF